MEKIRKEDIAQLRFLSGILLSPDKKQAVCTITESDLKKNSYRKDLYLFKRDCNDLLRMTWSGNNAGAVWDDSGTLLFSSERKEEDKAKDTEEKTVFYRLNIHGGEAREAFTVRKDVLGIRKIKDGVYAMLVDTDWNKPDPELFERIYYAPAPESLEHDMIKSRQSRSYRKKRQTEQNEHQIRSYYDAKLGHEAAKIAVVI